MGLQDGLMSGRQEQVKRETVTEVHAEGNIEKQFRLRKPSQERREKCKNTYKIKICTYMQI